MEVYYAQIREDCRVEQELMLHCKPKNIVVIGSGGCTAFSILNDSTKQVYCVDQNIGQCALIELKKAALLYFDHKIFLAFLGEYPANNRLDLYHKIRKSLPVYAGEYWDQRPDKIVSGANKCGVTEQFYSFIGQKILQDVYSYGVWEKLFACQRLQEQIQVYKMFFDNEKWNQQMLPLLSKTMHLQFYPAFMFAQAEEYEFGEFFLQQFNHMMQAKLMRNNYFLSQILFGKYLEVPEGRPYYLSQVGFDQAKRNLHKLKVIPGTLQDFLENQHDIEAFFLSNIFDTAPSHVRDEICQGILCSAKSKACLLYRNMNTVPPLPSYLSDNLNVDADLSQYFSRRERSMLYQKVTVSKIK